MTREQLPETAKQKEARKSILASYEKAQAAHERVMAGVAKGESDKFTKINDALNASKESDPKDKLGNTVPSKQTQYLEAQLLNILGQASQRGRKLTPEAAGMEPEQLDPETGRLPIERPTELQDTRGITGPAPPQAPEIDFSQPASVGERVEVATATGETVQVTVMSLADAKGMVKVRLQDGTEAAIPESEVRRIDIGDPSFGLGQPDPGGQRGRFQQQERRTAILRDIQTGL
jgi:hypothetical protein